MRVLRDWSGIIFMAMLVFALLVNLAEIEILSAIFILAALLPYALCWYTFARLADTVGELPLRRGLAIAVVGTASLLLAVVEIKVVSATGWILLGLAMLAVARTILRNHLLPNGFGWFSGFLWSCDDSCRHFQRCGKRWRRPDLRSVRLGACNERPLHRMGPS